tara:strand:+ start:252 stop:563 length:312 start_codon:yes stop_codon:yes gene_type:complete
VSTADGKIVSLDTQSGVELWVIDTHKPMFSSSVSDHTIYNASKVRKKKQEEERCCCDDGLIEVKRGVLYRQICFVFVPLEFVDDRMKMHLIMLIVYCAGPRRE